MVPSTLSYNRAYVNASELTAAGRGKRWTIVIGRVRVYFVALACEIRAYFFFPSLVANCDGRIIIIFIPNRHSRDGCSTVYLSPNLYLLVA